MANVIATMRKKDEEEQGPSGVVSRGTRKRMSQSAPTTPSAPNPGRGDGVIQTIAKPFAAVGGALQEFATPEGGFTEGGPGHLIGQAIRGVGQHLKRPVEQGMRITGEQAGHVYRGIAGIPDDASVTMPNHSNAQAATPAAAVGAGAAAATPSQKVVQRPAARRRTISQPQAPVEWTQGGGVTEMSPGIFATGQGDPTHVRWGMNQGGAISNLTLPIGQDPNKMKPEEYQSLIEREDPAARDQVSVIRGLREFKGGKEIEDANTERRRMADNIASMIGEYQKAVAGGATPQDRQAISGIIQQQVAGEAQKSVAQSAAWADAIKARIGAAKEAQKAGVKMTDISVKMSDPNNPTQSIVQKMPVVYDTKSNTSRVFNGNYWFTLDAQGRWVPPKGLNEDEYKLMFQQWLQMRPNFATEKEK